MTVHLQLREALVTVFYLLNIYTHYSFGKFVYHSNSNYSAKFAKINVLNENLRAAHWLLSIMINVN